MSMMGSSYGVLAQVVATAGSLIAASAALALCWKGRFKWEPAEEDIPRAAQKFGGLIIAITISILWFRFSQERSLASNDLVNLSIAFGLVGLGGLVIYSLLVGVLVYVKVVATNARTTADIKIIGGFWLTAAAKTALASGAPRPMSVGDLLKGAQYNEDYVWPRLSRALAKVSFQLAYILMVAGATCALGGISLLIASTL